MTNIVMGIFIVLHGLVHLLYLGQSRKLFELQPGMIWPEGSWAFSRLLGTEATRLLASVACGLAAIGFVAGGIGIIAGQPWSQPVVLGMAALSAIVYFLFWNGKLERLDNQGAIGILINIAIVIAVLTLQ